MSEISRREKWECVRRELAMRREVYPKLIARGKLRRADAEREIAIMAAIAEDYREPDFFSTTQSDAGMPPVPEDDRAAGRPPHRKRGSR